MHASAGRAAMVSKDLAKEIRSHKDLAADAVPLWKPALKFYNELAAQLIRNNISLDVFACALEQSGLAEMKPAIQATGGLVVQTDTFRNPVFKDSLSRVFAKEGQPGFSGRCSCATLDVQCSSGLKVMVRSLVIFLVWRPAWCSCVARCRVGHGSVSRRGGGPSEQHGVVGGRSYRICARLLSFLRPSDQRSQPGAAACRALGL